jgi:gamma-glutamyl hercynylcysteine S-oxide synthase
MLATQNGVGAQQELLARMSQARRQSDSLFNLVRAEAIYDRPIPERHRIIFYFGHLEAFDWNLLHDRALGLKSFHPDFDRLFAFGIDPVGGGLPQDQPSDWPSIEVVREYVSRIRAALDEKLANESVESSEGRDGFPLSTLLNVAIEHRLMHLETLAYMLHQLPLDRKIRQTCRAELSNPVYHRMIEIPAGPATLGLSRAGGIFGWDNEYERHTTEVPAFEVDQYKVTNAQYLDFVRADGYETRSFWNDADWNWRVDQGISQPLFWKKLNGEWLYRTMFDEIPLPPDWPVYVSHAEASAYARWAGKSLPTEEQWHRAAFGSANETSRLYPWGNTAPDARFGNFDLQHWDPTPVNTYPLGKSAFGVNDILGNGWEWTSTIFAPFPGFEPFPFYRGYSADFFDGKHFVMKGASARTAACMLRPSFRNWFQPHYQYVYAGFRCVSCQS